MIAAAVVLLVLLCLSMLAALVALLLYIERMIDEHNECTGYEHAKCMSMVAAFVGDEFAARVLVAAADDYDSAEGQANARLIGEQLWVEGGPGVPSLWLRDRAETILEQTHVERAEDHTYCERMLSGECIVHHD